MRQLQCSASQWRRAFGSVVLAVALAGCGTPHQTSVSQTQNPPPSDPANLGNTVLQSGDKIRIELTGIPIVLPYTETLISEDGTISVANISSPIKAAGKTSKELEAIIHDDLVPDYYTHATVTVTPLDRYFTVGGQINQTGPGGRVQYMGRTTVNGAIYAAGGFNDFAAKRRVQVTRVDGHIDTVDCIKALKDPKLDLEIFPGDRIYVPRRGIFEAINPNDN